MHANELIWMAVVALVLRPLFNALHDMLVHQSINPSMTNLIRWQNHRYVLKQSLGFFQNDFAGRIAQRIMQTGNSLRDSAVQVVDALWHVLIYTVSALVLFAEADWRLMIPLVLWVFAYVGALAYFVPQVKRRSVEASDSRSKLMGRIVDGYTNITTLKLFAHTRQEEDYAREAIGDQTLKSQRAGRVVTSMDVTITVMNGVLITGTTGLALWLWSQELISVGAIALATGLVIRINNMSGWIMWVVGGIFENIGQVQDGMQTIALPRKVVDREDAQPLRVERGEVEFEHIAFHYGKGSGVIQGLDLKVRPGEKIGLVGPSGAGKSTLVNLLLRLYDLESGRILVDGQDIAGVTQESLRAQIGMVTQDTSLLHRSIRDNLLYGRPGASDAELMEAVRKARADEFIPLLSEPMAASMRASGNTRPAASSASTEASAPGGGSRRPAWVTLSKALQRAFSRQSSPPSISTSTRFDFFRQRNGVLIEPVPRLDPDACRIVPVHLASATDDQGCQCSVPGISPHRYGESQNETCLCRVRRHHQPRPHGLRPGRGQGPGPRPAGRGIPLRHATGREECPAPYRQFDQDRRSAGDRGLRGP